MAIGPDPLAGYGGLGGASTPGGLPVAQGTGGGSGSTLGGGIAGTIAGGPIGGLIGAGLGRLFGGGGTPANPMVGDVATQPVTGDSLTQFFRSLSNLTGVTGQQLFNKGGETIGAGLGTVGAGLGTQGQGLQTLQDPINFYQKILSGDPAAMSQALAPTAALIGKTYAGATQQAGEGLPQGGYRSVAQANLPFAEASQIGNAALQLQPQAAQALGALGGEQAQIGRGVSETGLGVAGVGQNEQAQALQTLMSTIQATLQKMGINIQGGTANTFGTVASTLV